MGIRSKIMYGFLTLAAMLFLAGIISIMEFRNMGQSVEKLLDENYTSIASSQQMTESIEKYNNGVLLMLMGKLNEGRFIIKPADSIFNRNLKLAKEHITLQGEDSILNCIDSLFVSYRKLWLRPIMAPAAENKLDWYFNTASKPFNDLTQKIESLREMNSQSVYKTTSSLKNKAKRAVMPGIVAIIAALVFSLIFNYFINHYFVSPIIKISKGVNDYSAYGIPFKVDIETNDELLDLKSSVENMVNKSRVEKS
jgi:HAMP domain-containing protein